MTEDEARDALAAAQRRKDAVERDIRDEIQAAEAEIRARYRDQLRAAVDELMAAQRALTAAQDSLPDHPWTGKRVFKMVAQGRYYERRPSKRVDGIVETMRSTTALPGNTAFYRRPRIGEPIVRAIKADGSPSLKFEPLNSSWKLVEEGAPQ